MGQKIAHQRLTGGAEAQRPPGINTTQPLPASAAESRNFLIFVIVAARILQ